MQQHVSELGRPIVLSDRALRKLARIKDAQREHLQRYGRMANSSALAERRAAPAGRVLMRQVEEASLSNLRETLQGGAGAQEGRS